MCVCVCVCVCVMVCDGDGQVLSRQLEKEPVEMFPSIWQIWHALERKIILSSVVEVVQADSVSTHRMLMLPAKVIVNQQNLYNSPF